VAVWWQYVTIFISARLDPTVDVIHNIGKPLISKTKKTDSLKRKKNDGEHFT
jgi:hypothetical protein